jgi:hypothetical protein
MIDLASEYKNQQRVSGDEMTKKRESTEKPPATPSKDESVPIRGPWPDPHSREEISHTEAEIDAGKHSKNQDWTKKW